jgi:hypothetical protein
VTKPNGIESRPASPGAGRVLHSSGPSDLQALPRRPVPVRMAGKAVIVVMTVIVAVGAAASTPPRVLGSRRDVDEARCVTQVMRALLSGFPQPANLLGSPQPGAPRPGVLMPSGRGRFSS